VRHASDDSLASDDIAMAFGIRVQALLAIAN
jgi:hypothetical protein